MFVFRDRIKLGIAELFPGSGVLTDDSSWGVSSKGAREGE